MADRELWSWIGLGGMVGAIALDLAMDALMPRWLAGSLVVLVCMVGVELLLGK